MAKNINDQIRRELIPVAQEHVNERNKVTGNWETEVKFGYRISATEKQITLTIVVENSGGAVSDNFTVGDLWRAIDKTGTRGPYPIRPKTLGPGFGGFLKFQGGYQPKTRPIARYGGPGRATGPIIYKRQVTHPGIKPRKFSQTIGKKLNKRFEKAIDRGVRLGSRKG